MVFGRWCDVCAAAPPLDRYPFPDVAQQRAVVELEITEVPSDERPEISGRVERVARPRHVSELAMHSHHVEQCSIARIEQLDQSSRETDEDRVARSGHQFDDTAERWCA